jgi:phospholipid/cholesterol/gamma-HCH transport system substrate-binding protein
METRANYTIVGASVLAALVAIAVFVLWLGAAGFDKQEDTYYTYFSGSVTGLSPGGPVRYRGVPVGTVGQIEIDPQNVEQIRVTLKVQRGTPVKVDTVASLEQSGITGGAYIELTGGTRTSPLLIETGDGNTPVIRAQTSTLQSLEMEAPELLQKLNDLADRANQVLSPENVQAISQTFSHLESTAASLDSMTPGLKQALVHFDQLETDLHTKLPPLLETFQQDGTSVKGTSDELRKLATNINAVVEENRAPLRNFTGGGLSELTGLIEDLRGLSNTLTRVADHLDRDPQRYLFGGGANSGIDPNRHVDFEAHTGAAR